MEVTPAEAKANYGEVMTYVKEHADLAVSPLYIAQVKQKHDIIERENYHKLKAEDSRHPKWVDTKMLSVYNLVAGQSQGCR